LLKRDKDLGGAFFHRTEEEKNWGSKRGNQRETSSPLMPEEEKDRPAAICEGGLLTRGWPFNASARNERSLGRENHILTHQPRGKAGPGRYRGQNMVLGKIANPPGTVKK